MGLGDTLLEGLGGSVGRSVGAGGTLLGGLSCDWVTPLLEAMLILVTPVLGGLGGWNGLSTGDPFRRVLEALLRGATPPVKRC